MAAWDDRKTWRARKAVQERMDYPRAEVGQVWRDEVGRLWLIEKVTPEWLSVTTSAPGRSTGMAVQASWLTKWTRES